MSRKKAALRRKVEKAERRKNTAFANYQEAARTLKEARTAFLLECGWVPYPTLHELLFRHPNPRQSEDHFLLDAGDAVVAQAEADDEEG